MRENQERHCTEEKTDMSMMKKIKIDWLNEFDKLRNQSRFFSTSTKLDWKEHLRKIYMCKVL